MMLLEMATSGFGDRVALRSGDTQLSYGQLFSAAAAAAAEIRASGCSHVALLDVSSPAVPVALFASAWAGVPFVPLNYRLTGAEVERLIEQVSPVYLVSDAERVDALAKLPDTSVVSRDGFLATATVGGEGPGDWNMDGEALAILLFTSGTTGAPKAAVLRHKHLVSYVLGSVEFGSAAEDEAALVSVPPYHIAGMAALASSIYAGRRVVQLPNFSAEGWLDLARGEGVTNAFVVPTMLARIAEALGADGSADVPRLRSLSYGGGKMPLPVIERAMRLFPEAGFTNAYGLTETSSTISVLGPEEHRAAAASGDSRERRRLTSVGRALPSVEVEIRDTEGRSLAAGEHGQVYVRGEQVSGEYLGRGSTLVAEGWFPTRDEGWLDDEGYLFLGGRMDDVIVRGGENMSPGEIEDVLLAHPAVGDCAVVGLPDEQWGESVAAVVVLESGQSASESELQGWVRERMRSSRTPQRIDFCSELPYNETGKLLRRTVREQLIGETS